MAGDLSQRIATGDAGDEFDELAHNLNAMLERIERLLVGMRQVTEDIAHDLRTPLTRMRSRIEVALLGRARRRTRRGGCSRRRCMDAERLIDTFNALLAIARAEAGAQHGDWERLDLSELARDVVDLYEPLAEENGIALHFVAGSGATVLGHRQLVAQAIANITDNAVKYTPAGGTVTIATSGRPTPSITVDRHRAWHSGGSSRACQAALRPPRRAALDAGQRSRPEPGRGRGQAARREAGARRQPPRPQGHPAVSARPAVATGAAGPDDRRLIRHRHSNTDAGRFAALTARH